jgi:5'-nucleotidase
MNSLLSAGHDVRICTAPISAYRNCVEEKHRWVETHMGAAWVRRLILTKDKTLVRGDVLIDDRPSVGGVLEPTWEHLIFDAPYNRDIVGRHINWTNYREVLAELERRQ